MAAPKLIAERRFGDVREMLGDIQAMLAIANLKWTDVVYVKTFESNDNGTMSSSSYASILRLWEETLTDGSKVYNLHIL
jgi:hypothetical protein